MPACSTGVVCGGAPLPVYMICGYESESREVRANKKTDSSVALRGADNVVVVRTTGGLIESVVGGRKLPSSSESEAHCDFLEYSLIANKNTSTIKQPSMRLKSSELDSVLGGPNCMTVLVCGQCDHRDCWPRPCVRAPAATHAANAWQTKVPE